MLTTPYSASLTIRLARNRSLSIRFRQDRNRGPSSEAPGLGGPRPECPTMHNAERGFTRFGPGALGFGALSRAVTPVRGVMRYHTSQAGPIAVCELANRL